ncbi:hypothetical protein [Sphingobacterium endophyticum]|uniref:hypothetical protein n=1 Tax=Sphingobacterium endophyticum TaxID=2546448 RepID=UPI0012E28757|nr:hypothetical protein [Sphingobacterium endophyticum]
MYKFINRLKKILVVGSIMIKYNVVLAQGQDSTSRKGISYFSNKFPVTSVINLEYKQLTPYKFSSKYMGADIPETEINNLYHFQGSANLNFFKKNNFVVGTTLFYRYLSMNAGQMKNEQYHYHSQSLNLTYFSKVFGKTVIYSGSLITDGSDKRFHERMRGMASANILLKASRESLLSVGIIAFLDPSALLPALPSFTYRQDFGKGLIADILLPKGSYLRKNIGQNGRLSIGSELGSTYFYLHNIDETKKTYALYQIDINSGLTYEYKLGKSFIATFKTGYRNSPNSRVFEKTAAQRDYILQATPGAAFYFNAGISLNQFGKKKK